MICRWYSPGVNCFRISCVRVVILSARHCFDKSKLTCVMRCLWSSGCCFAFCGGCFAQNTASSWRQAMMLSRERREQGTVYLFIYFQSVAASVSCKINYVSARALTNSNRIWNAVCKLTVHHIHTWFSILCVRRDVVLSLLYFSIITWVMSELNCFTLQVKHHFLQKLPWQQDSVL